MQAYCIYSTLVEIHFAENLYMNFTLALHMGPISLLTKINMDPFADGQHVLSILGN